MFQPQIKEDGKTHTQNRNFNGFFFSSERSSFKIFLSIVHGSKSLSLGT